MRFYRWTEESGLVQCQAMEKMNSAVGWDPGLATVSRDVQAPCKCRVCVLVPQPAHTCIRTSQNWGWERWEEEARINVVWQRHSKAGDTSVETGSPAFFCSKILIQTSLCFLILERNLDSLCSLVKI